MEQISWAYNPSDIRAKEELQEVYKADILETGVQILEYDGPLSVSRVTQRRFWSNSAQNRTIARCDFRESTVS